MFCVISCCCGVDVLSQRLARWNWNSSAGTVYLPKMSKPMLNHSYISEWILLYLSQSSLGVTFSSLIIVSCCFLYGGREDRQCFCFSGRSVLISTTNKQCTFFQVIINTNGKRSKMSYGRPLALQYLDWFNKEDTKVREPTYLEKTSALRTDPTMFPRWGTLLT